MGISFPPFPSISLVWSYLSLSATKMTRRSSSSEAKIRMSWRTLRQVKRHSKSTCSSRESMGRRSSSTCSTAAGEMCSRQVRGSAWCQTANVPSLPFLFWGVSCVPQNTIGPILCAHSDLNTQPLARGLHVTVGRFQKATDKGTMSRCQEKV